MAGEGSRSGLLTAGGIFAIISGAVGIFLGAIYVPVAIVVVDTATDWDYLAIVIALGSIWLISGIFAMIGGLRALGFGRRSFGWAIAGGICALLCGGVLGLLALIFIAMSKREFT